MQVVLNRPVIIQHVLVDALHCKGSESGVSIFGRHLPRPSIEIGRDLPDIVRVLFLNGIQLFRDRLLDLRGGDGVRPVPGDQHNDVAGIVAAEDFFFDFRCAGGLRVGVVPTFLAEAVVQLGPKHTEQNQNAGDDQRRHDAPVTVGDIAPRAKQ